MERMIDFVYDFVTVDTLDAEKELEEVCGFLKKANIRHWLSSGTLLGIYRDNKFLEGDTDIDIGIRGEDMYNNIVSGHYSIDDAIPWLFKPHELRIVKKNDNRIYQTIFKSPRNIAIDLMWFWEDGDNIINKNNGGTWVKPKERFENLEEIEFKGVKYPCPNPEWYLEKRFKSWKTRLPKEGKDWGEFVKEDGFLRSNYATL